MKQPIDAYLAAVTPEKLAAITDVAERTRITAAVAAAGKAVLDLRDEGIIALLRSGVRPVEICKLTGMSSAHLVRYTHRAAAS